LKNAYCIVTQQLGLRNWQESDLKPFIAMNQDPDVMRFFPHIMTSGQTEVSFGRMKDHYRDHGYTFFAADHLEDQTFIGFIGLANTRFESHFTPCVEIGWRLMKKYWGRGLATEGAAACLDFAFDTLDIEEVYSFTPMSNLASERVMQKTGMKPDGSFMHPMIPDHLLEEHLLYRRSRHQ
jgi:RimJ/RimL family protein N-acetyltransferase